MSVFFLPAQLITPPSVTIVGELLRHLRDSLRIQIGEVVLMADDSGRRFRAEVTAVSQQAVSARILEVIQPPAPRAPALTLGQALLKGDKMDWVIQKATELGASTIMPLLCRHSMVQPKPERIESQTARWRRIALEAAQQSEQWRIPMVTPPQEPANFGKPAPAGSLRLILVERQAAAANLSAVELPTTPHDTITVLVGPEGGWAKEELADAAHAGFVPITMGSAILRAETAAIIAVGILQYRLGSLG